MRRIPIEYARVHSRTRVRTANITYKGLLDCHLSTVTEIICRNRLGFQILSFTFILYRVTALNKNVAPLSPAARPRGPPTPQRSQRRPRRPACRGSARARRSGGPGHQIHVLAGGRGSSAQPGSAGVGRAGRRHTHATAPTHKACINRFSHAVDLAAQRLHNLIDLSLHPCHFVKTPRRGLLDLN
jgi:hypothetical protein